MCFRAAIPWHQKKRLYVRSAGLRGANHTAAAQPIICSIANPQIKHGNSTGNRNEPVLPWRVLFGNNVPLEESSLRLPDVGLSASDVESWGCND